MDLETLRTECLACTRCPLHETRTHVVFGQGVADAEVLFVGEGPGQSEDEQALEQEARHKITYVWVKGHAGHPENERCDQLAVAQSQAHGGRQGR